VTGSTSEVIQIKGLSVAKGNRTICGVAAATISRNERIAIVGANGSGKSTLLRVLAGIELDFTGLCSVAFDQRERVLVHQSPFLFSGTVRHNVEYGLAARSVTRPERRAQAGEWLDRLGMSGFADHQASTLSGGERRRVAMARACVLRPKLMLLDEPFAELDESGVKAVQEAIRELSDSTILIASPTPLPDGLVQSQLELQAC
jgi:ABC-type nitrate/sulfonate/bicarbonate transport system ATPase subunit